MKKGKKIIIIVIVLVALVGLTMLILHLTA